MVAIKTARGSTSIAMMKNESEIMKQIESDYFPKQMDFQVDHIMNRAYLIMEYIEGTSLDDYMSHSNNISEEQACHFLKLMVKAVAFLHSKGVVHRDIKPQNVIITPSNELKIIDFNISKLCGDMKEEHKDVSEMPKCKFYGRFFTQISSPLFAAPELSNPNYYTESIDIWGIGILFLICLSGMEDFKVKMSSVTEKESIADNFKDETQQYSDYSKTLLGQMLSPNAEERPSISELARMIEF